MSARPLGGAVLVEGAAELRALLLSVVGTKKRFRRDGHAVGPQYDELESAARQALSANGTTDFRPDPPAAESVVDPIGTAEAAEILGCGTRNVTRIASSLGGQRIRRQWIFSRAEVLDYAEGARDMAPTPEEVEQYLAGLDDKEFEDLARRSRDWTRSLTGKEIGLEAARRRGFIK